MQIQITFDYSHKAQDIVSLGTRKVGKTDHITITATTTT